MKTMLCILLLGFVAPAAAADLASEVASRDGWVAYRVPIVEDAGVPCCFSFKGHDAQGAVCDLDGRNQNWGTSDDLRGRPLPDGQLAVYLRVEKGQVTGLHALGNTCGVKSATPIRWIENAAPAASVALLTRWTAEQKRDAEKGLMALAMHGEPGATRALEGFAQAPNARALREQALFWLGQARGAAGADIVERVATLDPDAELRANAIFALSQSKAGDPYLRIRAIAQTDANAHVRSQGLFWMAQMHDERARADIVARIRAETSEDAIEQAVFALSQLEKDEADAALIAVLEGDFSKQAKQRAMFWLGQSGSPEALKYFDKVLGAK